MENQIYSYSMAIVAKTHNARIIEWFDLHVNQIGNQFGYNFDRNKQNLNETVGNSQTIDNKLISNINWKSNSDFFIKIVGKLFSNCVNQRSIDSKNTLGQEFTPMDTVSIIFDGILKWKKPCETTTIIDFACGTGNFIGWSLRYQLESFFKQQKGKIEQQSKDKFLATLETLSFHLIALDIDPLSCFTTRIFTTLIVLHFINRFNYVFDSKLQKMCLPVAIIQEDFLKFTTKFPKIIPEIILGNPPYLFSRNLPQDTLKFLKSRNFQSTQGQFDLSDVFLEQSMDLLQSGGVLGVIIPETITILENRKKIRRILINTSDILKIQHVSDTFTNISVENILLFARKNEKETENTLTISWECFQSQIYNKHDLLEKTNSPLTYSTNISSEIIEWIEDHFISINEWNKIYPETPIKVFRGVELSKKGDIMQCPMCCKWMPYSQKREICPHCSAKLNLPLITKRIITEMKELSNIENFHPFISHFTVNQPCTSPTAMIELGFPGIQFKNLHNYSPHRILVRQLLAKKRLCVTTVDDNSLTSQSIYNIILPQLLQKEILHLRKILISEVISYYNYSTFSKGKRLFSRILLQKLKTLPWLPLNRNYSILPEIPSHYLTEITELLGEKDV